MKQAIMARRVPMRPYARACTGGLLLVLALSVVPPAKAACTSDRTFGTYPSAGACRYYCYIQTSGDNTASSVKGFYWVLGEGPTRSSGNYQFDGTGGSHPWFIPGSPFADRWSLSTSVNDGQTTGCPSPDPVVFLFSDSSVGGALYGLAAVDEDLSNYMDYDLGIAMAGTTPGTLSLQPIPRPQVTDATGSGADIIVDLSWVPNGDAAFQTSSTTITNVAHVITGWRVYKSEVPGGGLPPSAQEVSNWTHIDTIAGATSSSATITFQCDSIANDAFLALAPDLDNGFRTTDYVSLRSLRFDCDGCLISLDNDDDGASTCIDCNDGNDSIYPGATQRCDGVNNDCNDTAWPAVPADELDVDGDQIPVCGGDCDDSNDAVYPGAPLVCDGVNNDCNDVNWPTVPSDEADADTDTYRICANDCDDSNPAVNPGATEVCNTIDDDCDTLVDEDALGEDTDGDTVHNLCDNCVVDFNPPQSDFDDDFEGDLCDLDDGLIYLFYTDPNYSEWYEEQGFDSWNNYKGNLIVLRSTCAAGDCVYTQEPGPSARRDCGLRVPWSEDFVSPLPGEGWFFLTTGVSGGMESGLGTDSHGVPRPNDNPCP